MASIHLIKHTIWLPALWLFLLSFGRPESPRIQKSLPLCQGVTFSAYYLSAVGHDGGPGFEFVLVNKTSHGIKLAEPIPSSSHWYARSHGRWLWRASNGAGGSLVNAGNPLGRVAVYPAAEGDREMMWVILPPHKSREWVESPRDNPVLEYKPGCALCSYPGETEYQVVFAYAYLAPGGSQPGQLSCGLRSSPVPMPPKN